MGNNMKELNFIIFSLKKDVASINRFFVKFL